MSTISAEAPRIVPLDLAELSQNWSDEQKRAYADKISTVRLGILIRQFREAAGLTQMQLAHLVGTSQPHISDIERGAGTQGPTVAFLVRIAAACGVELVISGQRIADTMAFGRIESADRQEETHPHGELDDLRAKVRQEQLRDAPRRGSVRKPVISNDG